jgi:hypothetical protein
MPSCGTQPHENGFEVGDSVLPAFEPGPKSRYSAQFLHAPMSPAPHLNIFSCHELGPRGAIFPINPAPHVNPCYERLWRRGAIFGGRAVARCIKPVFRSALI